MKTFTVKINRGQPARRWCIRGGDVVTLKGGDEVEITEQDWGDAFRGLATRIVQESPPKRKKAKGAKAAKAIPTPPKTDTPEPEEV